MSLLIYWLHSSSPANFRSLTSVGVCSRALTLCTRSHAALTSSSPGALLLGIVHTSADAMAAGDDERPPSDPAASTSTPLDAPRTDAQDVAMTEQNRDADAKIAGVQGAQGAVECESRLERSGTPPPAAAGDAETSVEQGGRTERIDVAGEAAERAAQPTSMSPSTPTRPSSASSPSTAATGTPTRETHGESARPSPTSSPAHGAPVSDAPDSSPISARSAASSSPSGSPSSQASQSPSSSGSAPSRRVKVYRLKDDAWVDLGTGTCSGVFLQATPAGDEFEGGARISEEDEGAWIIVKKEKFRKRSPSPSDDGSPSKRRRRDDGTDSPTKGRDLTDEPGVEVEEEEDEDEVILRTRVQPYPQGYAPEDLMDEDEFTSVDENGNTTVDAGGYQRQQDTLIVWTERSGADGEEEQEMALSFATPSGCGEMWEFIKAARRFAAEQQALRSPSPSPSLSSPRAFGMHGPATASLANSLPEPSLGNIAKVENAIRQLSRTVVGRERAASVIVRTGYIEKLVKVQREAEDLESIEELHALCRVMQAIFHLNDNAIFEHILKDEIIIGVVGILEYDPDFPTMRASYREHLSSPSSFVSVIPLHLLPATLLTKIHQTHRLHYLKDVVLARVIEDSTSSLLNSAIYFNEVDIVNEITQERELLKEVFKVFGEDGATASEGKAKEKAVALGRKDTELFGSVDLFKPSSTDEAPSTVPAATELSTSSTHERKLHATLFLQQLSQMAKNLQIPVRTTFYKTMCERGLLPALEGALRFADEVAHANARKVEGATEEQELERLQVLEDAAAIRQGALSIWISVVDLDAVDVRGYCLRQGRELEKRAEEESANLDLAAELEAEMEKESKTAEELEREKREKDEKEARRTLLGFLVGMLKEEEDLGVKAQLAEALRVLVDATSEGGPMSAPARLRVEDPEAERFLQYFYDHCVLSLVQPLVDLPETTDSDPPLVLSESSVALLTHICDLLCFFVAHHTFRSKYLILSYPAVAKSIARLLRPRPRLTRHTHLRLAALRFLRACVARNDDFYNRFLIKHDLIRPVLDTAEEERDKDNLLGSACLEFFEYLRTSNAKALLNHLMDRAGDTVRNLAKTNGLSPPLRTFESLIARWEMNNEPPPLPLASGSSSGGPAAASSGATSRCLAARSCLRAHTLIIATSPAARCSASTARPAGLLARRWRKSRTSTPRTTKTTSLASHGLPSPISPSSARRSVRLGASGNRLLRDRTSLRTTCWTSSKVSGRMPNRECARRTPRERPSRRIRWSTIRMRRRRQSRLARRRRRATHLGPTRLPVASSENDAGLSTSDRPRRWTWTNLRPAPLLRLPPSPARRRHLRLRRSHQSQSPTTTARRPSCHR
ncbi:Component of IIS longevity pathway SMK-1-domain containing protein [Rhodotorula toruloides]|uniref:Component of IIS longevity pathway SMK-1-domain containing protein n=1 Tax=Rhodotorula toruloides TaxID=5286 RepID=A0A2T0AGN2_RHOTO|nr:Component of IIS longevity pathway SMK-1-domain containing protein [Rhodotorula toruloides]